MQLENCILVITSNYFPKLNAKKRSVDNVRLTVVEHILEAQAMKTENTLSHQLLNASLFLSAHIFQ